MPRPPSRYRAFDVVLDGKETHALRLGRAPRFMRFVVGEDGKPLDALDQHDDEPKPGERLVAAVWVKSSPVHFKFSGKDKQKSGWYLWVQYKSLPEQPPEEVLRETGCWRAWCLERAARSRQTT